MQHTRILLVLYIAIIGLTMSSCRRCSNDVWEDSKTAGRHMSRGIRSLGGKHGNSRAIQCRDEFMPADDGFCTGNNGAVAMDEFVPLSDQSPDDEIAMADFVSRQPRETPGDPGSSIPGIGAFQDASSNPTWAAVFRNITFEYNSNLVKGQDNLETVRRVADYMNGNSGVYVFVEGHCDERGPEAYNLALGARRGNAVRNMLIEQGVSPDNLFTISYGKERPLIHDHNDEAWNQNRRAEFKIYQR